MKNRFSIWLFSMILLMEALLIGRLYVVTHSLPSQMMADRWANTKGKYAQTSTFISERLDLQEDGLMEVRGFIDASLQAAGVEMPNGNGRIWTDAYAGFAEGVANRGTRTDEVEFVGIGGDFFLFHPFHLVSGGYIGERDSQKNRVVLEESTAWRLFGSNDIVDMEVRINGVPLYVAGVIRDKEKPSPRSGEVTKSVVYASYQAWSRLVELPTIQCYETVLPNLISNFGYQQIEKAFQMRFGEEGEIITVENSNRFAFRESWKNVFDSQYSLDTSGINLPHWELRARVVVREAALLVACVFIVFFALLCVSVGMWIRWRRSS